VHRDWFRLRCAYHAFGDERNDGVVGYGWLVLILSCQPVRVVVPRVVLAPLLGDAAVQERHRAELLDAGSRFAEVHHVAAAVSDSVRERVPVPQVFESLRTVGLSRVLTMSHDKVTRIG